MKRFPVAANRSAMRWGALCLGLLCWAAFAHAASPGLRYTGRVLYRANKAPAPGVLVELVEAEDNGAPTNDVLGSARADAEGRFMVVLTEPTDKNVTLVVSAVRTSADSGGDRREEGFDIKSQRTRLGFLPHPSPAKPNTVYIERRRLGHPDDN